MFGIGKITEKTNPDFFLIQQAKEDYVLVHDFYQEHPELLKDITTRSIYNSLMQIDSPDVLNQWLTAIGKTELALANAPKPTGGVHWENVLGHYAKLVERLSGEERALLAGSLTEIRDKGYSHYFEVEGAKLMFESLIWKGSYPNEIVILNDQTDDHVAVGEDADRLFEMFGWQTATAKVAGRLMSVMPISDDVLRTDGIFDFHLSETTVDLLDICVTDPQEAELSLAQQTIDAFRRSVSQEDIVFPVSDLRLQTFSRGIEHDHRYPFVEKLGDSLSLFRSDAVRENIVTGQAWNVDRERIPLLTSLAERLHVLMHDMHERDKSVGMSGLMESDMRAMISIEDYMDNKTMQSSSNKRLLLDHGQFFEAYSNDAVSLAREFHRPLWTRDCGIYGENIMLILSPQMANQILDLCDDVEVKVAMKNDNIDDMRLRPSIINDYLGLEEKFEDASILQKKDGGYAVRASLGGAMLPMKDIPKIMGERYSFLSDTLAKKVYLNGILHSAYGNVGVKQDNPLTLQIK